MKLDASLTAKENARAILPKLARKYFEAGRSIIAAKKSADQLHDFRLETKRFRYTLELFRPLYGPTLDAYLKALRDLQGSLGAVSDYQAIQSVLSNDKEMQRQIDQAVKVKVRELRQRWRVFDSPGQLKRWGSYLAGEHSTPKSKRSPAATVKASPRSKPVKS